MLRQTLLTGQYLGANRRAFAAVANSPRDHDADDSYAIQDLTEKPEQQETLGALRKRLQAWMAAPGDEGVETGRTAMLRSQWLAYAPVFLTATLPANPSAEP